MGTLIICKQCKEYKIHGARGLCEQCYIKQWNIDNREKQKLYIKLWQVENAEKIKEWYFKNKEKRKLQKRKWYDENRTEILAICRKYRRSPVGKLVKRCSNIKRRSNGMIEKKSLSKLINENILKYGIITCEKCKKGCKDSYHIDHIVPISKDGSNEHNNLQILCAHCNQSKYVDIADYRENVVNKQFYLNEQI